MSKIRQKGALFTQEWRGISHELLCEVFLELHAAPPIQFSIWVWIGPLLRSAQEMWKNSAAIFREN